MATIKKRVIKRVTAAPKKKPIPLSKRKAAVKSRALALYRAHLKKRGTQANPLYVNQIFASIGTDNSWFNAQIIPRESAWVPVPNANYVWYSGNLSNQAAVVSRQFRISQQRNILSASLFLSVDNYAVVLINGVPVVYDGVTDATSNFNPGRTFSVRSFLRRGLNDIVIVAFNFGGQRSPSNPAGVAARLDLRLSSLR